MNIKTVVSSSQSLKRAINLCCEKIEGYGYDISDHAALIVTVSGTYERNEIITLPRDLRKIFKDIPLVGSVAEVFVRKSANEYQRSSGLSVSLVHTFEKPIEYYVPGNSLRSQNKSVGRWPKYDNRENSENGKRFDLAKFNSVSRAGNVDLDVIPEPLRNQQTRDELSVMLSFSDNEPHELLQAFNWYIPNASKIGLVGTRTPFVTGTPYTIFHNDDAYPSGFSGLAFKSKLSNKSIVSSGYPGLATLGNPLAITKCRGNIVLELENSNAMRHLLRSINLRHRPDSVHGVDSLMASNLKNISPDKQMYAKLTGSGTSKIYRVIGGDPTKGTIAIETTDDLMPGMKIEFGYHTADHHAESLSQNFVLRLSEEVANSTVLFTVVHPDSAPTKLGCETVIENDIFIAGSEAGVIFGQTESEVTYADIPFMIANLSFRK
ncbi:hypothetical protein HK096_002063 [Nowakowskiella sp. JEL0078]|nr:hypothetical protein HK096_002063 [Nowakowskiella sp. JEL0078]